MPCSASEKSERPTQHTSHFSRYINHAEHGNLEASADPELRRIDFYAARDIPPGEELTYDYGPRYWLFRPHPSPESDSRNFSDPKYRIRPPELSLLHPPALGSKLPLTPLTTLELQAALALPEPESLAALRRCVDYFGARRTPEGLQVPFGLASGAETRLVPWAELSHASLQRAAVACITSAVLTPADASGAAARALEAWLESANDELGLIRRWRARTPRFASARHDAVALAAFLIWKNPGAHEVALPLGSAAACNGLVAEVAACGEQEAGGLERVLARLAQHAPDEHVRELVAVLTHWYELGDGCTVASHHPPSLAGVVSSDLRTTWGRVPRLVEHGLLSGGS